MAITRDTVLYTAQLARLKIEEQDIEKFTKQIGDIIRYVEKLNQLDVAGVEPTAHALPVENVSREDRAVNGPPDEIIYKNAPVLEDRLFIVPQIIE
jgi:aspartyl-tRNA(Asn)/glutamyl-tRNA(Gln) amidotransferase subunit C